jgi:hypothetical protein
MTAVASSQSNQQPAGSQSTGAQSASSPPTVSQPDKSVPVVQPASPKPIQPSPVAAAASASRSAHESAPPTKIIRNHDISNGSNPPAEAKSQAKPSDVTLQAAQDKETQEEEQRVQQFETQGKAFQNQIKVEKGKIIDIQNHIASLKDQFAEWSTGFAQDDEASQCWTSAYYSPYYKDWCDRGKHLKAQYEASQRQLAQEKARLEQMQEDIRRKGYGNAVYDPD